MKFILLFSFLFCENKGKTCDTNIAIQCNECQNGAINVYFQNTFKITFSEQCQNLTYR